MTGGLAPTGVRNPLQLFGLYLAWAETALSASVWATQGVDHWTRYLLIGSMSVGLLAYVGVTGFLLVHIVTTKPGFLFNPSDYDKTVQPMLFGAPAPVIQAPPVVLQPTTIGSSEVSGNAPTQG